MANNFLTTTTNFKPYSFDEMLAPVAQYTTVYNELDSELANLDVLTSDIAGKLSNPKDAKLLNEATNFQGEVNTAINNLYEQGLNPQTRRQLNKLKSDYTSKLNPISEAYTKHAEFNSKVTEAKMSNPNMIIEGDYSVSDFMGGATPTMLSADKSKIQHNAMAAAAAASKRIHNSGINDAKKVMNGQYFSYEDTEGYTAEEIETFKAAYAAAAINGELPSKDDLPDNLKPLVDIVEQQRKENGYDNFSDSGKLAMDNAILNGIYAGAIGDKKTNVTSNKGYDYYMQNKKDDGGGGGITTVYAHPTRRAAVGENAIKRNNDKAILSDLNKIKNGEFKADTSISPDDFSDFDVEYNLGLLKSSPEQTYEKYNNIARQHGIDPIYDENGNVNAENLDKLINAYTTSINNSVKLDTMYSYNAQDQSQVISAITDAARANSDSTSYIEINSNGVEQKSKDQGDIRDAITDAKEKTLVLDPEFGLIIVTQNDKGELRKFKVQDSLLTDPVRNRVRVFTNNYKRVKLGETSINDEFVLDDDSTYNFGLAANNIFAAISGSNAVRDKKVSVTNSKI